MLIPLSEQDPDAQDPPNTLTEPARLEKFVILVHQNLSQRFRISHQHPWLVEQPPIIDNPIIGHRIHPLTLRLPRRILEYTNKMAQERISTLRTKSATFAVEGTWWRAPYRRRGQMTQWTEEERIHKHAPAKLHAQLHKQQRRRIPEEAPRVHRKMRRISPREERDDSGADYEGSLGYRHDARPT